MRTYLYVLIAALALASNAAGQSQPWRGLGAFQQSSTTQAKPSPGQPAQPSPSAQPAQTSPSAQPAQPQAPAQVPSGQSGTLKIVVLQGEGARNNVRTKSATVPAVEVRDEQDKPVPGAEVVFQLPPSGPGAVFHGWMRTQTTRTNAEGQATVTGYTPNDEEGRFNIRVTANTRTHTGSAVISQVNVRGESVRQASAGRSKLWTVVAVAGAAALGGGIYAAVSGDDATTPAAAPNPVVITPGAITVGGPR